ncbi:flavoprotein [Paenisporosarcina sp. TG20]|uniref:flavoprotein n=1 Tax=Paenisporosarcina sp. TG20 TaxID=1211706 RepID=UPI0002DAE860|nr:flavoprotein [Paenisporosarcina sp. TG20]
MTRPKNILLGLTGSINLLNISTYIAAIQNHFSCRMHIMMTPSAQSFIPASTLIHSIDGHVFVDLSEKGEFKMPHVELTHWADIIIILPASANTIAKTAHGFAQDIVSATVLAADTPTILFPSMYIGMWRKNNVQRNVEILREDGFIVYPSPNANHSGAPLITGGSLPTPNEVCRFISDYV